MNGVWFHWEFFSFSFSRVLCEVMEWGLCFGVKGFLLYNNMLAFPGWVGVGGMGRCQDSGSDWQGGGHGV